MEGVTTELDERFSEPEAEPTPWAETERNAARGAAVLGLDGAPRWPPARDIPGGCLA
jgi:hypothetical protein